MPLNDDEKDELLLSCRYGDLEDVQAFIQQHGKSVLGDVRDNNQNTLLHMICANGHLELLKYLLPLVPSSLLSAQNSAGSTPLHWAALNAHLDVAKALVELPNGPGLDLIDIKNAAGHSPLAEAESSGWDEGAKWLVEVMNLESETKSNEGGSGEAEEADIEGDVQDIELEIQDADGQIAKMRISSGEPAATPTGSCKPVT